MWNFVQWKLYAYNKEIQFSLALIWSKVAVTFIIIQNNLYLFNAVLLIFLFIKEFYKNKYKMYYFLQKH